MAPDTPVRVSLADLIPPLLAAGTITAADVALLRQDVFADGLVDRAEADALFRLNDACRHNDPAWDALFVDALTDYFIWRTEPFGYLSGDDGRYLVERVTHDGRIDGRTELELLVNVVHWAKRAPEAVVLVALDAVKRSVLDGSEVLFGPGRRRPGVIDRADVEILSRVIYAGGGEGSLTVTRREADLLFDLNDATRGKANADGWQDLFVRAVGSHLMFPTGEPEIPAADEAVRRHRWLDDRRGIGAILAGIAGTVVRGRIGEAWGAADLTGARARAKIAAKAAAVQEEATRRAAVDETEAAWLEKRLAAHATIDANERALLAFIKAHAAAIPPLLARVMVRAGV